MTLPLIYALQKSSSVEKRRIINLVKNHSENKEKVAEVINYVRSSGGMDYAKTKMLQYQQEAFDILATFPNNRYKLALEQLVRFTTDRDK